MIGFKINYKQLALTPCWCFLSYMLRVFHWDDINPTWAQYLVSVWSFQYEAPFSTTPIIKTPLAHITVIAEKVPDFRIDSQF